MIEVIENAGVLHEEVKLRLEKLPVSAICDGLTQLGVPNGNVLPGCLDPLVSPRHTVVGLATTVYAPTGSAMPVLISIFSSCSDRILVVATDSHLGNAYLGDIQAYIAKRKGCLGLVIDGYIRDSKEIKALDLPVFCRGKIPNRPNKSTGGYINKDIVIGGVLIKNGDVVCADDDGVVIIPFELLNETIEAAEQKEIADEQRRLRAEQFDYIHAQDIEDYYNIMSNDLKKYIK
ncbi:RraA family protein [Veillonella sp. R32]|uniref:RraA family protein n=1 Tax=Veillonella sp. R32 TaxID=2021312 RepID=UPI00138A094E|nr:RraA family protein [Veillonella sp. R32]KAF1683155.1 hypothetical protein VER_03470 [Veillonella sp. R32]